MLAEYFARKEIQEAICRIVRSKVEFTECPICAYRQEDSYQMIEHLTMRHFLQRLTPPPWIEKCSVSGCQENLEGKGQREIALHYGFQHDGVLALLRSSSSEGKSSTNSILCPLSSCPSPQSSLLGVVGLAFHLAAQHFPKYLQKVRLVGTLLVYRYSLTSAKTKACLTGLSAYPAVGTHDNDSQYNKLSKQTFGCLAVFFLMK